MRFLLIGPAYPLRGGIANFNTALYNEMQHQGHDVSIYSFSLQYPGFLFPGKTQFETGDKPANLNVESVINSINPFNWFQVAKKVIKWNPDVIVVQFWMPFFALSLGTILRQVKKKSSAKIITITHNFFPHEKRPGDTVLLKYYTKASRYYIALSKSVQKDISEFQPGAVAKFSPHPIYSMFGNMVDKKEAREKLQLNEEDKVLLFFGIVRAYKGLDLLIEAVHQLKDKSQLKVIVAGEFYDDKKKYVDLIQEYKLEKHFIIRDEFIPGEKVKYYFCAADLVVQPYHSATQSGVTQIAYHFEAPMLVTDVGGLAEIVPHGKAGYVVDTSAAKIARAIEDFYENGREEAFSKFVAEYKKNFSWDKLVRLLLAFS